MTALSIIIVLVGWAVFLEWMVHRPMARWTRAQRQKRWKRYSKTRRLKLTGRRYRSVKELCKVYGFPYEPRPDSQHEIDLLTGKRFDCE